MFERYPTLENNFCIIRHQFSACAQANKAALTEANPYDLLCAVAKKRGFLIAGGELNTERAADIVLDEFREAKIGRITLELPGER